MQMCTLKTAQTLKYSYICHTCFNITCGKKELDVFEALTAHQLAFSHFYYNYHSSEHVDMSLIKVTKRYCYLTHYCPFPA